MPSNQYNIRRRTYLTTISAVVPLLAGCTAGDDPTDNPTQDKTPALDPAQEFTPEEEEADACNHRDYEDEISYVSRQIHTARRKTHEFIDDTSFLRATKFPASGNCSELVMFPPGIYRGNYMRYVLSAENAIQRVNQYRSTFDRAHDSVDACPVPVPDQLHDVIDDAEQKTDYYISAVEAFISAAEIYQEQGVYIVENPSGSGAQPACLDTLPAPNTAREYLLEAILQYERGKEMIGIPLDLETQIRYAAR